jgi:hypothetical protein
MKLNSKIEQLESQIKLLENEQLVMTQVKIFCVCAI